MATNVKKTKQELIAEIDALNKELHRQKGRLKEIRIDISESKQLEKEKVRAEIAEVMNKALKAEIACREKAERSLIESEQKYRLFFEHGYTGIAKVSPEGRFLQVNRHLCNILGYEKHELESMKFMDITHPDDIQMSLEVLNKFQNNEIDKCSFEKRYIGKNGNIIHGNASIALIRKSNEEPDHFISFMNDITEMKLAEEKLIRSLQEKEVLLKELHHRVKNNLQIMSSMINLKISYVSDPKTVDILKDCQNRINTIAIIHETLYQKSDLLQLNFKEYVGTLARNLVTTLYPDRNEDIDLVLELEDVEINLEKAIPCGLIINELVSNSLKHALGNGSNGMTPAVKKQLIIKLNMDNDEGDNGVRKTTLVVADNGTVALDEIHFRNSQTLGLQLVTTLVEQIGGKMNFNTKNGTEITIKF